MGFIVSSKANISPNYIFSQLGQLGVRDTPARVRQLATDMAVAMATSMLLPIAMHVAIHHTCAADQSEQNLSVFFGNFVGPDGSYLALLGLPGLRFNSLDLRESSLDPIKTKFRPKIFSIILKNQKIQFQVLNWPRTASGPC